jgi:hypothetical protein
MVLAAALVSAESSQSASYDDGSHNIPQIPLHIARQIMTRADFIKSYDHINLFTITSTAHVRADSVPMQRAFRSICSEPGFDAHLEATLQRISDIESLGRTREIVAKDLVLGGRYVLPFFFFALWFGKMLTIFRYKFLLKDGERRGEKVTEVMLEEKKEGDD